MLHFVDVCDVKLILNRVDVDIVDDANELLMVDDPDVVVDVLEEVMDDFIPMIEMTITEVDVNDADNDVSPLDVVRLAGSISKWTRTYDVQYFPLMQR